MIKCETRECIIQGHPIVTEAEFICICKAVKSVLVKRYGEARGIEKYTMLLETAEMSDEEISNSNSRMRAEDPFIAAMAGAATEMLMNHLFGGGHR